MKKTIAISLVLLSIVSILTACGKEASKEMSRAEKAKAKAIEICDNYLDFDITPSEAKKQLEDIQTALGDKKDENMVNAWIGMLIFDLTKEDNTSFEDHYKSLKSMNLSLYE